MEQILGAQLQGQNGTVDTSAAMEGKKAVALYFSAHWCPPCRGFTPQLAEWYTKDLQAKGLEVVFVSSDRDEGAFNDYFGEQPWLSLPYADRDKKNELSKKYKVQGIPSLVIVDPATGATINTEGRNVVAGDPTGEKLPWTPLTKEEKRAESIKALGDEFLDKDGQTFSKADRFTKDFIGIYFSAHWCPPCRNFTPKLAANYAEGLSDKMEIVFVSSDRDEAAFKEYLGEMPWLALPYSKREEKEQLSKLFGVEGIPTFVVLDKDFNVITTEGTQCIGQDSKGETLPDGWKPQPSADVNDDPSALNNSTCVIAMGSNAGGIQEVANEYHALAGGEVGEMKYRFYTCKEGPVEAQVRKLTNTTDAGECLIVLDIPDDGGFYKVGTDVSAGAIRDAIAKLESNGLERSQLSKG
jgi:nucleoredoxin